MYNESDIDDAVAAGALSPEAAAGLRAFLARRRPGPLADEEQVRLLSGFNDIFVVIAALLMLVAVGWLGARITPSGGGLAVAALSWGLAELFTRRRRMALPSILLLLGFVGGVFLAATGLATTPPTLLLHQEAGFRLAGCAALAAAAAWLHWRRFMVPITLAAGAGAGLLTVAALLLALVPSLRQGGIMPMALVGGLALFALAMRWDCSDRERLTRRSDVAFWLHLGAAPLIVHPIFSMLGVLDIGADETRAALGALATYAVLAVVALAVDRRALLVSALIYVFYALGALFQAAGTPGATWALAALVIGSALLMLSAFWQRARRPVLALLPPSLQARLPAGGSVSR